MIVKAAIAVEAVLGGCPLSLGIGFSNSFWLCLGLTRGKTDGNEAKSGNCLRRNYRTMRGILVLS